VTDFFSAADDFLNTACTTTTTLLTTDPHVHEHNHNHAIVLGGVTACTTIATTVSSGRRGVNIPPAPRNVHVHYFGRSYDYTQLLIHYWGLLPTGIAFAERYGTS
jgi:hypothetical protein